LELGSTDKVPNEKTIWLFREELTNPELEKELFKIFHLHLEEKSFILNEGKIIDTSYEFRISAKTTE
jgi:hypothetical protein